MYLKTKFKATIYKLERRDIHFLVKSYKYMKRDIIEAQVDKSRADQNDETEIAVMNTSIN